LAHAPKIGHAPHANSPKPPSALPENYPISIGEIET
jgi:hypothetical protein